MYAAYMKIFSWGSTIIKAIHWALQTETTLICNNCRNMHISFMFICLIVFFIHIMWICYWSTTDRHTTLIVIYRIPTPTYRMRTNPVKHEFRPAKPITTLTHNLCIYWRWGDSNTQNIEKTTVRSFQIGRTNNTARCLEWWFREKEWSQN